MEQENRENQDELEIREPQKELSRRDFLAWLAGAAAIIALPGCDANNSRASIAPSRSRDYNSNSRDNNNNGMANASVSRGSIGGTAPHSADLAYASYTPGSTGIMRPVDDSGIIVFPDPPPPIINPSTTIIDTSYGSANQLASYSAPAAGYATQTAAYNPGQSRAIALRASYAIPAQPTYSVQPPPPAPRPVRAAPTPPPPPARIVPTAGGKVSAISRNTWGAVPANPGKMRPMNGVRRLTIHHEGSAKPNNDTHPTAVAATLRLIQSQHHKRLGAGDIGYHFIIDRAGVIWQGRDWSYQGAHTSGANPNNIGVMLLGNFEIQQPTQGQLQSLHSLMGSLVRKYGLNPATDIYGHNDFCNTACPGRYLQPQVGILRRSLRR